MNQYVIKPYKSGFAIWDRINKTWHTYYNYFTQSNNVYSDYHRNDLYNELNALNNQGD